MRVFFSLLVVLLAGPGPALGQDRSSDAIASLRSGVVCDPETAGLSEAPDTISGTTHVLAEDPPFVSESNRVPAVLGIGFGVKSMSTEVTGLSDVTLRVTHPPMGADGTTAQSFQTSISGTRESLAFYQFDYAYEMVPGPWVMTAEQAGVVLFETRFEVLPPEMVPELAGICGFEELLS